MAHQHSLSENGQCSTPQGVFRWHKFGKKWQKSDKFQYPSNILTKNDL